MSIVKMIPVGLTVFLKHIMSINSDQPSKFKGIKILMVSIITLCFTMNCSQSSERFQNDKVELTSIKNEQFYAPYCLYLLDKDVSIEMDEIKTLISNQLPLYELVDSLSGKTGKNEFIIESFSDPKNEYPAPDIDYLQHSGHGLSSEEMTKLQSPHSAVLIAFSGISENIISVQIKINEVIASLVNNKNIVITDYTTYESFNSLSWNTDRVLNFNEMNQDITSQFTIHLYREDQFCRAVTMGLGKFCLPDISIQNISCRDQNSYASLINLISQTWLENPTMRSDSSLFLNIDILKNDSVKTRLINTLEDGASKYAILKLSSVLPQEGDAYNSQFEIVFNDKEYSSIQENQSALISQLFGSSDEIDYIKHNDEILLASKRAKEKLPVLKELFNKGLEPGYSLLLKAPFETDAGGNEWMWIEVIKWQNTNIRGILQNDPFEISDLKAGAIVNAREDEIFDYLYYHPDGTMEGNETGEIISRGQ